MSYWSVAILVVSVLFLAYHRIIGGSPAMLSWLGLKNSPAVATRNEKLDPDATSPKEQRPEETRLPSTSVTEDLNSGDDEGTPKASATTKADNVPIFSLDQPGADKSVETTRAREPQVVFPATNSAPKVSSVLPPARAAGQTAASSLMPPPKPRTASLMPPPTRSSILPQRTPAANTSASLRIPSNGPLPNRGPPVNSPQRAGSNSRGRILLSPGHSPMDWAELSRNSNLAGVPTLQRVTPSQLKTMTGRKGKPAWSSYMGKVYNITPYLPFHPGGEPELMKAAGRDGGKLFMEAHPWVNWEGMLASSCVVGILVSETEAESELDEQD